MPISYGVYEKQVKLLPLTMQADGSADITLKYGFIENSQFNVVSEKIVKIAPQAAAEILDSMPQAGMTRRDDLAFAIYNYLVTNGLVEPGQIS